MATFKRSKAVNLDKLAEAPKSGAYINTSGVYDITLKALTVDLSPWGTTNIGMYIDFNGTPKMMYSVLDLGPDDTSALEQWQKDSYAKAWDSLDKLAVVCGIDPSTMSDTETVSLPIGKDGAEKDVEVFPEISDVDIKAWFKFEYYRSKEGEIKEKVVFKEAFTPAGLSADEVLREDKEPKRLTKLEKYITAVSYKSELTQEIVDAWIADGRKSGEAAPKVAATKPSFTKPKFGAK